VFERPGAQTRRGRPDLLNYVKRINQAPGRHQWDDNLLMAPDSTSSKVSTFGYDLLLNVDVHGTKVHVSATGTLQHTFTRSDERRLIDYRIYKAARTVPISWPAPTFGVDTVPITGHVLAARTMLGLTAADHITIEQLYSRNNVAFDGGAGEAFARMFTADRVLTYNGATAAGANALATRAVANMPPCRRGVAT
jgi:hypothetical protein